MPKMIDSTTQAVGNMAGSTAAVLQVQIFDSVRSLQRSLGIPLFILMVHA